MTFLPLAGLPLGTQKPTPDKSALPKAAHSSQADPMRHYGHLVAAQDNVSELHVRMGVVELWAFPGTQLWRPGRAVWGPLRVSLLDDHLSHFLVRVQRHS